MWRRRVSCERGYLPGSGVTSVVASTTPASVVVTYTVAVETEAAAASVSTLIEDSSTEDVSAAVKKAAAEAGVDEEFADVETTAVGTPTTALAPEPDDDAPTTGASEGSPAAAAAQMRR